MGFWSEFKQFAAKGNALDMAVGIIVGAAFNKIVNSLVTDIIMPPIGFVLGGVDFKNLQFLLRVPVDIHGAEMPAVAIRYGNFINTFIEFAIISISVFIMVKVMNKLISIRELPFIRSEKKP
jgi:large conductance mechanosensitive channel